MFVLSFCTVQRVHWPFAGFDFLSEQTFFRQQLCRKRFAPERPQLAFPAPPAFGPRPDFHVHVEHQLTRHRQRFDGTRVPGMMRAVTDLQRQQVLVLYSQNVNEPEQILTFFGVEVKVLGLLCGVAVVTQVFQRALDRRHCSISLRVSIAIRNMLTARYPAASDLNAIMRSGRTIRASQRAQHRPLHSGCGLHGYSLNSSLQIEQVFIWFCFPYWFLVFAF